MRKRYIDPKDNASVATESVDTETVVTNGRPVLSLEEEVVVLQEATDLQNKVQAGLEEAIRVEDVSNNLLDMADTVENVEEITPQQAALIDTAAEMAVAGTDTNPDVVIPSMESFIGTQVAVEGWRETAANVWRQIREYVEKLFAMIKEAFSKFFSTLPRQLERIKLLREVLKAKRENGGANKKAPNIQILAGVTALSYPGYLVKDARELLAGLKDIAKLGDWVFGQYAQSVKTQGMIVAVALSYFDPPKASETLEDVAKQLTAANFRSVPNTPNNGYMGCFELKVRRLESKHSLSAAQTVNALRHTYVALGNSKGPGGNGISATRTTIATPEMTEIENILATVEKLIKEILSFEGSFNKNLLTMTKSSLTASGNKAQAAWSKHEAENSMSQSESSYAMDVMKSLMNFNTTYAKWVSELPGEYVKRATGAIRASLAVCEKAANAY